MERCQIGVVQALGSVLKVEMTILDNQSKGISIDE
jgi:hypothetical protein